MKKELQHKYDMVKVLCSVKECIQIGVYSRKPGYSWLQDNWSNGDILSVLDENGIKSTREAMVYLEQMIHLFGKDR